MAEQNSLNPGSIEPPRAKPLFIYDGQCGFCRHWIGRWRGKTQDLVAYVAYQDIEEGSFGISREAFAREAYLVETDGAVYRGAEAVLRTLDYTPGRNWSLWCYGKVPGFGLVARAGYRFVASHRQGLSFWMRLLTGVNTQPQTHFLTRWLFLRLLAVVFLIAFWSLSVQIIGLAGENGIAPVADRLAGIEQYFGEPAYWRAPTLCWLDASDWSLRAQCFAGMGLSVVAMLGVAQLPVFFCLWLLYLSLTVAGGVFMNFQWDVLLLETGVLAILFAPLSLSPRLAKQSPPSRISLWLIRWLLFRLMFLSGLVKLTQDSVRDPTWHKLTALNYHYQTQPIPTWTSWYAHHLPEWFQTMSVSGMFVIELWMPLLIFAPRPFRIASCFSIVFLMVLIGGTGNYTFFNLLAIVLCVSLLDDGFLRRFFPRKMTALLDEPRRPARFAFAKTGLLCLPALAIVVVSTTVAVPSFGRRLALPESVEQRLKPIRAFRSVNSYGLFRAMTTTRPEIVIEGSNDGREWLAYEFRWKPGDLKRRPAFVQPHQPRLDWQMWFAALGDYRSPRNRWFTGLMRRLQEGSPEVVALLDENPFPDGPPLYLRATLYNYEFTDAETRDETGAWWQRERLRAYFPTIKRQ